MFIVTYMHVHVPWDFTCTCIFIFALDVVYCVVNVQDSRVPESESYSLLTFSTFFGNFGFGFGNQGGQREIPRGGTITMDIHVSLEDLYKGSFIEVSR